MASWSDDIDAMVRGGAPAGARTPSAAAPKSWADDIDKQVRGGAPAPESPTSIFRRAAQWAKPVGDVVSMPFRGLGMLGTEAQEAFGGVPDAESRIKVQPGASTFDSIVGNDVSAPTPADLAMEGLKVIPQALDETTDVRRPGALAGDAQDERQRFATANPGLARTEAVAEPVLNLGLQLATDPSIAALGPLGKAASGGSKAAAIAERLIGASFVPGMAEGAIDKFHEAGQAADEHGMFSPEAIRAGVGGGLEAAMAAFGAKHALAPGAHVPAAAEAPPREVPIAPEAAVAPNVWPGQVPPEMAPPPPAAPGFEPPVMHFAPEQQALTPEALGIFDGYVGQDRMPPPGQFFETPVETPERRVEQRRQEQLPVPGLAAGTTFDRRLAEDPRAAPDLLEVPRVGGSEARGRAGAPQENGAPAGAELRPVPQPDVPAGPPVPDVPRAVPETETPRAAPAPRPETVAAPPVNDVSGLPPEAAREVPETQPAPRGPDRREFQEPITGERRAGDRRAQLVEKYGETPAVDEILNLETEARTDPLTGLGNKRKWTELQSTIGPDDHVVMMDGKRFKAINDTYGHQAGDAVLQTTGRIVREVFGEESARPGGDEYGAVLRGMAPEQAQAKIAEFQRRAAEATTQWENPTTGEIIDIPALEVHIAFGKDEATADAAVNAVAAPSRKGGRGDVPIGDANRAAPEQAASRGPGEGLPPREAPVDAPPPEPSSDAAPPIEAQPARKYDIDATQPIRPEDIPPRALPQTIPEAPSVSPEKRGRLFDREGASERLEARRRRLGRQANDLGTAAFEGAGVLRDAAEIGASYIEDYARGKADRIPSFVDWARAVGVKLSNIIPNVGQHLRRIYDEAVALFRGKATKEGAAAHVAPDAEGAAAPAAPPEKPPAPPDEAASPEPMGRPVEPGEAPRVEAKAADVKGVAPDAELSRDTPRSWESLDPEIRKRLDRVTSDVAEESKLYNRAKDGKIDDVDTQVLDALVAGKKQAYTAAREKLMKAQSEGTATGVESVEYLRAALDEVAADYAKAARSDVEAGTKLARALAARARVMEARVSATTPDEFIRRVFRQIPDISDRQASDLMRVFQERPQDLADVLHQALKPGMADKALEAWKAGLVSAPGTQIANILGNVGEQVMRVGETATASAIDALLGGGRTRLAGEARYEFAGAMKGAGMSLGRLGEDLNKILRLAPEDIDMRQSFEHQVGKIGGKAGRAVRIPFRLLGAFDSFFKGIGGEAELHKLAFREAKGSPAEIARLVERDANGDLVNAPKEMIEAVAKSQQERTYQNPHAMAQAMENLRSKNRLLHVVLPFIKTPTNIAQLALERSPVGFVMERARTALSAYTEGIRNGADAPTLAKLKGAAVDAYARPLLGTMLMSTFAVIAKAGGMTGSGPADPKDKNALRDAGWQPYSFVVTDPTNGKKTYIPFNRFEPISSLLGFAADMSEAGDAKSGNDLLAKGVGSVVQNLASKTYLQGIADAAELVRDPMGAGSKYVTNLAGTIVPNVVAKTAQAIDPAVRDTRASQSGLAGAPEAAWKNIESRLPGLSTTLPERRGGTGETIERRGNALTRLLSPIQPSQEEEGLPFARMLVDLEAVPSAARKDIKVRGKDVRLTDEEYAILQDADKATTKELQKIARASTFQKLGEEQKRSIIRNRYEHGRAMARNKVLRSTAFTTRARKAVRGIA